MPNSNHDPRESGGSGAAGVLGPSSMSFQTVTNFLVVVALAVNSFILFRLSSELDEANRKLEKADEVMNKALVYSKTADDLANNLKQFRVGLNRTDKAELKAKAKQKLGDLIQDAIDDNR